MIEPDGTVTSSPTKDETFTLDGIGTDCLVLWYTSRLNYRADIPPLVGPTAPKCIYDFEGESRCLHAFVYTLTSPPTSSSR